MADKVGQFVWHEVHTDDVEKSKKYYSEVLDWKEMSMDMPDGPYLMLAAGDKQQMGVLKSPMEGAPPHFAQYLAVEDVDATAAAAEKAGGKILVPGTDIPVGRFAVIADPQGAAFALWKSAGDDEEEGGSTEFHWHELWSPDSAAVAGFYEEVFGFTTEKMDMPDLKDPYLIFKKGEDMVGGAMTSPMEGVPAMWLPYIKVADVEATIERAKARGGEQLAPTQQQPGIGKFAVVKEPQGAVVGLITPAAQ